eukprot:997165-Alexandrium_andersonii.AAC.1
MSMNFMLALSAETAVGRGHSESDPMALPWRSKSPAARNSSSTSSAKASQKGSVTCRRTAHATSKLRSRRRVR